jgi:hypothetical protein
MNNDSTGTPAGSASQINADGASADPYGLDTIPPASYAFFLVRGELNATFARGYVQPAVGIEIWRQEYSTLPVFVQATRIWVVLNDTEDNLAFVESIAADKSIRRRCIVSTCGVQTVTKSKMLWDRQHSYSTWSEEFRRRCDKEFEAVWHFQAFPTPSERYKIRRLGTPRRRDVCPPQIDRWR